MSFITNSAIYNMITGYYFHSLVWMILTVLSILYLIIRADKAVKTKIILAIVLTILTVGNDLSYIILVRFFAAASYYRFYWMVPYILIVSYTLCRICMDIYYSTKLTGKRKCIIGVAFVLIFIISIVSTGSLYLQKLRDDRPQNAYMVDVDTLELQDIMNSEREAGNCEAMMIMATPSTLALQYQTVDAGSYMAVDRTTLLDIRATSPDPSKLEWYDADRVYLMGLCEDGIQYDANLITKSVQELAVGYIVVHKAYELDNYMSQFNYNYVGETTNYKVYRTY